MANTFLFTITILLGLCIFQGQMKKIDEPQLFYNIFKDWTAKYNKQYGVEELAVRFLNWKSNYDLVQQHNSNDDSSKLEMNNLADMNNEEFSALFLGLNTDLKQSTKSSSLLGSTNEATTLGQTKTKLPKSVDWRKEGAVTAVKNQGKCGGCWSFSAAGALEGLNAIRNDKLDVFSTQHMIDCSSSYGNMGCDGGLMVNAYSFTIQNGIQLDSSYEYLAAVGECKHDANKVVFKNTGYAEVPQNNSQALKAAVARQPVSVGIEASSLTVQLFKSGIISRGCSTNLDHAVLVVGYDVAKNGQEYWIIKNSWGTEWGLNGYFHIAMGSQNDGAGVCGINMMASYPTL